MFHAFKQIDCDELRAFWECLSPVGTLFDTKDALFRGQRDGNWEATPAIYRKQVRAQLEHSHIPLDGDHPWAVFFEYALLWEFMAACDARGLLIPGDTPEFRNYMGSGVMMRHSHNTRAWPDSQILPLMALAQHHGVPTRLLDVTSSPYAAAYFAASSAIIDYFRLGTDAERISYLRNGRMAVYGIQYGSLHRVAGVKLVRVPGSTSPNLSAQSGAFLLIENSGDRGDKFATDVSLESKLTAELGELDTPVDDVLLTKITLPIANAHDLLNWCYRHGVHAATMYPGYDGAAKTVSENNRALKYWDCVKDMM